MKILWCENTIDPHNHREICIKNIISYYENKYDFVFIDKKEDNDSVYEYKKDDEYLCVRTVAALPNKDKWIEKMSNIINEFCEKFNDGFVAIHLGASGHDKANYYNNPVIRALMNSNIKDNHVIIYTGIDISLNTFYEETSYDYTLLSVTQTNKLISAIEKVMEEIMEEKD